MSLLDGLTVLAALFALILIVLGMKKTFAFKYKAPEGKKRVTLAGAIRQKVAETSREGSAGRQSSPLADAIRQKIAESNQSADEPVLHLADKIRNKIAESNQNE